MNTILASSVSCQSCVEAQPGLQPIWLGLFVMSKEKLERTRESRQGQLHLPTLIQRYIGGTDALMVLLRGFNQIHAHLQQHRQKQ